MLASQTAYTAPSNQLTTVLLYCYKLFVAVGFEEKRLRISELERRRRAQPCAGMVDTIYSATNPVREIAAARSPFCPAAPRSPGSSEHSLSSTSGGCCQQFAKAGGFVQAWVPPLCHPSDPIGDVRLHALEEEEPAEQHHSHANGRRRHRSAGWLPVTG